ncbi:MAG: peptide chain release factor 1 [Clostridiales bacterium]|nr:peptide chain release factor 1 [Clostridiales bacterium]
MFDKLDFIVEKYYDLGLKISDPEVINDNRNWQKLMKEHSELTPIVEAYSAYKNAKKELEEAKELLAGSDEDIKELAKMEIEELLEKISEYEIELKKLLLPKNENDEKNVIVEIRAGAGGDEAGLFASELLRMYVRYAERRNWKVDMISLSDTGVGGIKEASFQINGRGAYSRLKYESGVHRVQRVPETESGGRIHTSTATVAVLPEAEEVDVEINQNDLRVDVYRSSGNGGQSVNTTDSAVRITHLPTGMVVTCQDEKSQLKNKDKAMKVLRARLYDIKLAEQNQEIADQRKSQVGTGDRSGKIRTYNFPQGRITDHRVHVAVHKMSSFLDGDIDEMIDALITSFQAEALKNINE